MTVRLIGFLKRTITSHICSVIKLITMKTSIVAIIIFISALLKSHVYVFTIFEVISNLDISSIQDIFELFNFKSKNVGFTIGLLINLVIIYYTIKLKALILKKILTAPIVVRLFIKLKAIAMFLWYRYQAQTIKL